MSNLDRKRAQRLLEAEAADALALFQPEAFRYATGAAAGVATMWGRAGSAIALVPADPGLPIAAVVSDHAAGAVRRSMPQADIRSHRIWIDGVHVESECDLAGINAAYRRAGNVGPRPETFDRDACFHLLGDLISERGLAGARIAVDLEFMPAADFLALKAILPDVHWIDGSPLLRRLRSVKTPAEITWLRQASRAAEAGLSRMQDAIAPGVPLSALSAAWLEGARSEAAIHGYGLSGHWDYISVGADLSDSRAVVAPGALIKADVGTLVDGYSSDGARTFCCGEPTRLAAEIFKALEQAFAAGLEEVRPGNSFGAVHKAMLGSMRRDGFEEYYRGHFGHSVGGSVGIEEWPFFSHDNGEAIQPNMVVALEAPFYAQGFGALMIEDQFLVTETGAECMNSLSRALISV
ncbi:M24 family metallopeptidase [Rhizobium sp. SL42]|uniref:M24 family metallopeptidase n=1 Tax=Rhizobium sp. SL42 TaxID=2806346 RepID=UPI001F409940|nr:Xaa-Pro peptidase family protein [Rhizobium sp. SL42]UJW75030.1 aminopeptidase P family protein [Rhizobium sp. SL42]